MDGSSTASAPSIFTSTSATPASRPTGARIATTVRPPLPRPAVSPPLPLTIRRASVACKAAPVAPDDDTLPLAASLPLFVPPRTVTLAASIEARLVGLIDAPLAPGETAMTGFARKETELGTAFAQLTILDAGALHKRLSINAAGDALAAKFARLTVDRRNRLLTFLANARRREALAIARR